ncbi:MAG TPA: regulatory protein RecX [Streptosporangiaceae bacterium]|nr:regulatory protein RecX [Streptosporangiaceae bacterium]
MASRRHRRRTGADRFWPGPQTQARTGPSAGLTDTGDTDLESPGVPVQPSWSDNWTDAPDAYADPDSGTGTDDDGAPEAGGPGARASRPPRDPEAAARSICLRLITIEPRTRSQLAQAMQRKQIPDEVADSILDRFTEVGLIDDQAFARAWVESRHHSRGLSRRALSTELRRRGVADADVREAVETLGPDQEMATARQIIDRKLRSTRGQPPDARARRLVGALARKGYGPALSYRIVREALEAEGAELAAALDDTDPDTLLEDGQG